MTAVRAAAKELEIKYRQLWVAVEQSDIASTSWNVVKTMQMNIVTTYDHLSNLTLP